jgi:hypothetical protein
VPRRLVVKERLARASGDRTPLARVVGVLRREVPALASVFVRAHPPQRYSAAAPSTSGSAGYAFAARDPDMHVAFLLLACALVCWRRLTNA